MVGKASTAGLHAGLLSLVINYLVPQVFIDGSRAGTGGYVKHLAKSCGCWNTAGDQGRQALTDVLLSKQVVASYRKFHHGN